MRCCMDFGEGAVTSGELDEAFCALVHVLKSNRRTTVLTAVASACENGLVAIDGCAVLFLTKSSRAPEVFLRESEEAPMRMSAYAEGHKETDRWMPKNKGHGGCRALCFCVAKICVVGCDASFVRSTTRLGDSDFGAEIDVLDGVEELDAFGHGALEGFAAGDEAGAAGAFVDYGGGYGFFEVVGSGGAAAVDEACAAAEAVDDLIAAEIDGVVAVEFGVDARVEFAVTRIADVERFVAAVIFGKLLLDDVGLDGDAEMIGLTGEVGRQVIVLVFLEGVVAEVAPENGGHAEIVCLRETLADLDDLTIGAF